MVVLKETERLETYEEAKDLPLGKAARKDNSIRQPITSSRVLMTAPTAGHTN